LGYFNLAGIFVPGDTSGIGGIQGCVKYILLRNAEVIIVQKKNLT
jgi:hypothetical protein